MLRRTMVVHHRHRVSIVGGGITGAVVASSLVARCPHLDVHVFDQGRNGVGGRASHRITANTDQTSGETDILRWDHGCQVRFDWSVFLQFNPKFFRADTPICRTMVNEWIRKGWAAEWHGSFTGDQGSDFFGFPALPPFFVGVGGMQELIKNIFAAHPSIHLHQGTRVSNLQYSDGGGWIVTGIDGDAAYHDTTEQVAQSAQHVVLGDGFFDAVVLTDISSSFDSWHRASAGVPSDFCEEVRKKAGGRVPLFTAMVAFEKPIPTSISAASFDDDVLWFASRSNHKPGLEDLTRDCWTLISTPKFAMQLIEETPMQDPLTGAFIPQSPDYLQSIPAPKLEAAFRRLLKDGSIGELAKDSGIPPTMFLHAQRWGSALPSHRYLDASSPTRKMLSSVVYDGGRGSLGPTTKDRDGRSFVANDDLRLIQVGDMVSSYTPGVESAILSSLEAVDHMIERKVI